MTMLQKNACDCIELSSSELRATVQAFGCAAEGKRSALLEPNSNSGLKPALNVYSFVFRYPDGPNMLSEEGKRRFSGFQDDWDSLFRLLTVACSNREARQAVEDAQRKVHRIAYDALSGCHAPDEKSAFRELVDALNALVTCIANEDKLDNSEANRKHVSDLDKQDIADRTAEAIRKHAENSVSAKAFPFVCGYDVDEEWIEMDVYDAYNKLERRRFTIRNKKQWFYIRQFANSKTSRVRLKKYPKETRINLALVFRKSQGDDGAEFYKYVYSTTGSQARYWLEQRPRR